MNYYKQRTIAKIVMVIMIAGSILIGGGVSLSRLREKTEQIFYEGTDGYSVKSNLGEIADAAYNMLTVAKRYVDVNDSLYADVQNAYQTFLEAEGPKALYEADAALTEAIGRLYEGLGAMKLSDSDANYRARLYNEIISRNQMIGHNSYNSAAEEFNETLERFPANLLSRLTGVDKAEIYG